jgi:hypothetical protein
VAVPAVTPATEPLEEPIVALELLTDQVPVPVASLRVVDEPTQTLDAPVIDAGSGLMVTGAVA